jgi:biotin carboxyl carrier protein
LVYRLGHRLRLESEDGSRFTLLAGARELRERVAAAAAATSSVVTSPMPGSIVQVLVEEGDRVHARQPLVILEAMKMEHVLEAPADAVVGRVARRVGDVVAEGDLLVELTLGDQLDRVSS